MPNIGYARVSKIEQNLGAQLDTLSEHDCVRIFTEKIGSRKSKEDCQELRKCLDFLRAGDVLVVKKLDRLARDLKGLITLVEDLEKRGVQLHSVDDNIDTSTPQGKLFFHVVGAMAEFERDLIRQRTFDGLTAARARGRVGGRPVKVTPEKMTAIARLLESGMKPTAAAKQVGISRAALYKYFPKGKAEKE
jgi:DNA invertase Pin-like site-specific DNA recombinase